MQPGKCRMGDMNANRILSLSLAPAMLLLCQCASSKKDTAFPEVEGRVVGDDASDAEKDGALMDKFAISKNMLRRYDSSASQVDDKNANVGRDKQTYFAGKIDSERNEAGNKKWGSEHWLGNRYMTKSATESKASKQWKIWPWKKTSSEANQAARLERREAPMGGAASEVGELASENGRAARETTTTWLDRRPSWEANQASPMRKDNREGTEGLENSKPPEILNPVTAPENWQSLDVRSLLGKKR